MDRFSVITHGSILCRGLPTDFTDITVLITDEQLQRVLWGVYLHCLFVYQIWGRPKALKNEGFVYFFFLVNGLLRLYSLFTSLLYHATVTVLLMRGKLAALLLIAALGSVGSAVVFANKAAQVLRNSFGSKNGVKLEENKTRGILHFMERDECIQRGLKTARSANF